MVSQPAASPASLACRGRLIIPSCNSAADYFSVDVPVDADVLGTACPDQVLADGNYLRAAAIAPLGQATQQQTFKHLMNRVDWLRDIRGNDYYDRLSNIG